MDLVDSYVRAVAKALPEEQREDISRELSEDIHSEMDDKQQELGRALTQEELQALLKKRGNPLLIAARYRPDHRSLTIGRELVGPVLFPFYVKVLWFNLGLAFLVVATIFSVLAVSGQKLRFNDVASTCFMQLFIQLTVVTLIFSLVQRHLTKHPDRWHLKGMLGGMALDLNIERDIEAGIGREMKGWGPEVSRFESVSIIIASAVAIAWIIGVQSYPFLILGPGAFFLQLAPIWRHIYLPVFWLTILEIARAIINLARPDWVLFRVVYRIFLQAGGTAVAYMLLRAGAWVIASNGDPNLPGGYTGTVEIVNQVFYWVLLFAVILSVGTLFFRIVELVQRWRSRSRVEGVGAAAKEGN